VGAGYDRDGRIATVESLEIGAGTLDLQEGGWPDHEIRGEGVQRMEIWFGPMMFALGAAISIGILVWLFLTLIAERIEEGERRVKASRERHVARKTAAFDDDLDLTLEESRALMEAGDPVEIVAPPSVGEIGMY